MQEVKSDTAIPNVSCISTTFLPSTSSSKKHNNSNPSTPENRLTCKENRFGIAAQSHKNSALHHANYSNKTSICATYSTVQEDFNDFDVVWAKMKGYPWWPALFFWTKQPLQEAGFTSCFSTAFDSIRISEAKQSDSNLPKECLVLFLDKFNFSVLSYLPGETIRPFTGTYDSTLKKCLKDLKIKRFLSKRRLFFIAMKKAELLVHSNKMESGEDWNLLMELKLSESLKAVPMKIGDKLGRAAKKESQSRRIKRKRDASSMAIKPENVKMEVSSTAEVRCASMETQVEVNPVCLRIESESAVETKIEPSVVFVAEPDDFQTGIAPLSSIWTLDAAQTFYYKSQDVVWDSKVYIETCNHNLAETKSVSMVKHSRNGREDGRAYRKQASRLQQLRQALQSGDLNPHTMIQCTAYTDKNGDRDAGEPPFRVVVHPDAVFVCDLHAHLATCEIIGFLAGRWIEESKTLYIQAAFPCRSLTVDGDDGSTDVEMDPESELLVRNIITQVELEVVGWYHSHPTFAPDPSVRDIENQTSYQHLFQRGCQLPDTSPCLPTGTEKAVNQTWTSVEPFVGLIVGTYDTTRSDPVSLFRYFHTRADDCTSSCTKTQSVCLPYEFTPSIPVHCSVLAEEDRQGLLQATMYPSVYRDLFPFQQLQLVPSAQQNDELSPAKKLLKGNPTVKRTKPNESKKAQLGKRQPKRDLLLSNLKLPAAKKVRRRLQQSKKPEIENEAMTEVFRGPNIVSSVKDDIQAVFEGVDVNQTRNRFAEKSSQKKGESEGVYGLDSVLSLDAVSEAAAHTHDQSVNLKLNGKAIKKASHDLVGAVHSRKCDSEIDTEASDKMHEPESSPVCGKSPRQSTTSPMDHFVEKMNTANITGRRRNRKASRPMKRLIDPVTPSISNPAEPHFVVFDEEPYQKASSTVRSDADAENGVAKKPLDGTCKSSISRTEIPLIEDDSPQRPARPDTNETVPTAQVGSAPFPSSNSQLPLQHNSTREAGIHPSISPADRKSSTDISHERDEVDCRRPQRRSSAKYGSQLGLLNDIRNQLLHSLRTVYGERIQSCVEQVVALIDYYCKFDRRIELHQIWKARLTKIQKFEISLMENVKKLNLPVELRVAFVKVG
uniref:Metalloprotease family M67A putative n=1 Tax=Albugo laibachii Nc14 TaxID=890382 RepID=F0WKD1_9STRA|nr:metalloprotease family M67A putative [Albugo laibachii Nc14]|eukprot:CCA21735.1 metalloprotease family M67A putative [Albugo laibachii Nc14]